MHLQGPGVQPELVRPDRARPPGPERQQLQPDVHLQPAGTEAVLHPEVQPRPLLVPGPDLFRHQHHVRHNEAIVHGGQRHHLPRRVHLLVRRPLRVSRLRQRRPEHVYCQPTMLSYCSPRVCPLFLQWESFRAHTYEIWTLTLVM